MLGKKFKFINIPPPEEAKDFENLFLIIFISFYKLLF